MGEGRGRRGRDHTDLLGRVLVDGKLDHLTRHFVY